MNEIPSAKSQNPSEWTEGIDIVICTYNRSAYLRTCIESLLPQLISPRTHLTILDNNSSDDTSIWARALASSRKDTTYEMVATQGVSHCRNRAMDMTTYSHILFLDDECIVPPDFVSKALALLGSTPSWDVLGGPYYALYEGISPKKDPDDEFSFALPFTTTTLISTGFVRGGCMMIRTMSLRQLGGFDTRLGMKGKTIRYAEEIELQHRMRQLGFQIAYAPDLWVYHAVRPEKHNIRWKLYSLYARRRDKRLFDPLPLFPAWLQVCRTTAGRLVWTPVHLLRWVVTPSYTWRQCVLDILQPWLYRWGDWIGSLKSQRR